MNKYVKYIVVIIIIILLIIGIILINNNKPINKYKKEAKTIVNEYLNKNIDNDYAYKKISALYDKIDKDYRTNKIDVDYGTNKHIEYLHLLTTLSSLERNLKENDYLQVKEDLKDL